MKEFVQRPSERYLKYKKKHHCPKHGGEAKPKDCELCNSPYGDDDLPCKKEHSHNKRCQQ